MVVFFFLLSSTYWQVEQSKKISLNQLIILCTHVGGNDITIAESRWVLATLIKKKDTSFKLFWSPAVISRREGKNQ